MHIKTLMIAAVTLALTASSCSSLHKTSQSAPVAVEVAACPTVADLEINPEKMTRSVSWVWSPFNNIPLNVRKSNLMAEMVQEAGADILVEPHYIVKKTFLGGGELTLSGYPAKYKDFHKATPEEVEALKTVSSATTTDNAEGGKRRFLIF